MVLVKMLMEIDPLPMRGSMVMTSVMISPSRREVSPVEQLRRSPRLVPPRFRLVAAEFRPRRWLIIFSHRKTSYSKRWPLEGHQGAHEVGGAPPPSWAGCGPPCELIALNIFSIFWKRLLWSFRTFGAVQNRSLIFAPFPAQNPSCRHSPSLCKPCKIRENRNNYCDIMCNNNP